MTEPTTTASKRQRRTWRQRIKITLLVLLILAVALRIALTFLLPVVIRKVANTYDLDLRYSRLDLSILGGNANIWDLTLRPKSGGASIVTTDYVHGNISPLNLLQGRLVVWRAEVDGVDVFVEREADGSIPLLRKVLSPAPTVQAAEPTPDGPPQPIRLQSPLRIDALRLSHVTAKFRDLSVTPAFEASMQTTLRVSDVGSDQNPARIEMELTVDPLLDTLLIQGEAHATGTSLKADLRILMRGLHLQTAAGYLAPLGLKPVAESTTVQANLNLSATAIAGTPDISATLALTDISAVTDLQEWASLRSLTLDATKLSANAAQLGKLLIDGGRASAQRTANGTLRIAGLELVPTTALPATQSASVDSASAPMAPSPSATVAMQPSTPFHLSLGELKLQDLQASFVDAAVAPSAEWVARLDDLTATAIDSAPAQADAAVPLKASFSLPGIVGAIRLDGSVKPFSTTRQAQLKVAGEGIRPDVLKPYLDMAGIESQLKAGTFAAELDAQVSTTPDGTVSIDANASGIRFNDGQTSLFAFDAATIKALTFNAAHNAIGVSSVELSGPALDVRRDKDGRLAAAGFRTAPPRAQQPIATPPPPPPPSSTVAVASAPAPAFALPRIDVRHFLWKGVRLGFHDESATPATTVALGDAGIEVKDLLIDLQSTGNDGKPGTFRAWFAAPNVVDRVAIDGSITPAPHRVVIDATTTATGMTGRAIAPYLKPLGIEPVMTAGELRLKSKATLLQNEDGLNASVELADLKYNDGPTELLGLDRLDIDGFGLKPNAVSIGQILVSQPRARVTRHQDGMLEAGGIRLLPAPPPAAVAADVSPVVAAPAAAVPLPALRLTELPFKLIMRQLQLDGGSIEWIDDAVSPKVTTTAVASVTIANVHVGSPTESATLHVEAKVDGSVDRATVDGALVLSGEQPGIRATLVADGLRAGPLVAYLPAGVESTFQDGRFAATIDAGLTNAPAGGIAGHLTIEGLSLKDKTQQVTWAKVDSLKVAAARVDPAGGAIAFSEVSSSGVSADLKRTPTGATEAFGVRLASAAASPAPVPPEPEARPAAAAIPAAPVPAPPVDVAAMVADARRPLPLVTIDKLDLNLKQVRFIGFTQPDGSPLALSNVRLHTVAPLAIGGPNADSLPPVQLQIDGAVDPIVSKLAIAIRSVPFAAEPSLDIDVAASGIKGKGLTDVMPSLASTIDGSQMTDGAFHAHLATTINYGRRGPRDIDLARGFTATFNLKPLELRSVPDGPIIAGIEEVRGDGIKVDPATGGVAIKSIEVTKPTGRFLRDAEGVHAFGLLLPAASAKADEVTSGVEPTEVVATPEPSAPTGPPERPTNEVRLDRFTITGIDVVVDDRTTTPSTIVPLKSLDLEVRDLSNQLPWTGKPVRFSMLMTSDKVPLPPRKGASGPVTTEPAEGAGYTEDRELFSQITANGSVAITRANDQAMLNGWAKTSVNGFELLGVRGLAEQQGVTIGGGAFDQSNDIRFKSDGTIETKNQVVFTNLSLTEPADGPLQRIFKLPAPINTAIAALTDPDGSITLNLPVPIKNGTIKTGDVVGPAIGAVSGVLLTAIASAPVKAIGGIGQLVGISNNRGADADPPVTLTFLPGYAQLDASQAAQANVIAEQLRKDKHLELQLRDTLTTADVERARVRANPTTQASLTLAERLRRQKADLLQKRSLLIARAQGEIGSNADAPAADSLNALKAIDRQLATVEDSLDELYDLLRPGAESQAERRTRAASLAIGRQRLDSVRAVLLQAGPNDAEQRVHLANPQYDPTDSADGGHVVVTLVRKKR